MNKKVLIYSFAYYPYVGGAEVAVKEITDRIKDTQFDLVTYNLGGQREYERIGNVNVYRISGFTKYLYPIKSFFRGLSLYRLNRYDTVWAMMANTGFPALFLKFVYPKINYVLSIQEGDPIPQIKKRVWFVYPIFKMVFKYADHVTTLSNYLADFARSMGASSPEVVPNGVDLDIFKPSLRGVARQSNLLTDEQRLLRSARNDNDIILVTTSRLVKKNAVDDIIKSLKFLPPNVRFKCIGSGIDESILLSLVLELKLQDRVDFISHTEHAEMANILKSSDIFIRPSLTEGLGSSFLEAMAVGLPVIATPVGGIPDFLKDGETGLFCKVRDPEDIARKVMMLINNPELYARISKNGRELVVKKYDWNFVAERFEALFAKA